MYSNSTVHVLPFAWRSAAGPEQKGSLVFHVWPVGVCFNVSAAATQDPRFGADQARQYATKDRCFLLGAIGSGRPVPVVS